MNPEQIPIPLEKKVEIKNGVVEVSIAEMSMTDKEKKVYQKFMAKCVAASLKNEKDAMIACAVDFKKMKEELMQKEDDEDSEDDEDEEEDEEEDEMEEAESATKSQKKMKYRDKPKTSSNSLKIITVEQIRKQEEHEKNETPEDEARETKEAWRNTVDL